MRAVGTGVSEANQPIGVSCGEGTACLVSTLIPGSIAGDVSGPTVTRGASFGDLATGDYFGSSVMMVTGSVKGCGAGSFTVSLGDFQGNIALPGPADGVVVPGSGTGDLAGITGKLSVVFAPVGDGAGSYTYRMKLRCRGN